MTKSYFEARVLDNPKNPADSEWAALCDADADGEPVRGDTADDVRKQLREMGVVAKNVVIAHVQVTYIKV